MSRKTLVDLAALSLGKTWTTPCWVATKTRPELSLAWVRTSGRSGLGLPAGVSPDQPAHSRSGKATSVANGSGDSSTGFDGSPVGMATIAPAFTSGTRIDLPSGLRHGPPARVEPRSNRVGD